MRWSLRRDPPARRQSLKLSPLLGGAADTERHPARTALVARAPLLQCKARNPAIFVCDPWPRSMSGFAGGRVRRFMSILDR